MKIELNITLKQVRPIIEDEYLREVGRTHMEEIRWAEVRQYWLGTALAYVTEPRRQVIESGVFLRGDLASRQEQFTKLLVALTTVNDATAKVLVDHCLLHV